MGLYQKAQHSGLIRSALTQRPAQSMAAGGKALLQDGVGRDGGLYEKMTAPYNPSGPYKPPAAKPPATTRIATAANVLSQAPTVYNPNYGRLPDNQGFTDAPRDPIPQFNVDSTAVNPYATPTTAFSGNTMPFRTGMSQAIPRMLSQKASGMINTSPMLRNQFDPNDRRSSQGSNDDNPAVPANTGTAPKETEQDFIQAAIDKQIASQPAHVTATSKLQDEANPPMADPNSLQFRGSQAIADGYLRPGFARADLAASSRFDPRLTDQLNTLYRASQGEAPSVAQLQAQQSADLAGKQGLALLAQGGGSRPGASLYSALQNQTQANLQGGAQAAALRASEMENSRQLYSNAIAQAQTGELGRNQLSADMAQPLIALGAQQIPAWQYGGQAAQTGLEDSLYQAWRDRQVQQYQADRGVAAARAQAAGAERAAYINAAGQVVSGIASIAAGGRGR